MEDFWKYIIGFVTGLLSKIAVDRINKGLDKKSANRKEKERFKKLYTRMSSLFNEMAEDLKEEDFKGTRVIYISPKRSTVLNVQGRYFSYYEDEHNDLKNWINTLESEEYITNQTTGNVGKYVLKDHFVELIKKHVA